MTPESPIGALGAVIAVATAFTVWTMKRSKTAAKLLIFFFFLKKASSQHSKNYSSFKMGAFIINPVVMLPLSNDLTPTHSTKGYPTSTWHQKVKSRVNVVGACSNYK